MAQFTTTVYDERGQFEPRTYTVEAETEVDSYEAAHKLFLADTGLKPYKPGTSMRQYFSRFYFRVGPEPKPDMVKARKQADKYIKQVQEGRLGPVALIEALQKFSKGSGGFQQREILKMVQEVIK